MNTAAGGLAHTAGDAGTCWRASFFLPSPSLVLRNVASHAMMLGSRKRRDVNSNDHLLPETLAECIAGSPETALTPFWTCTALNHHAATGQLLDQEMRHMPPTAVVAFALC